MKLSHYSVFYSFDGNKKWDIVVATNKQDAFNKVVDKNNGNNIVLLDVCVSTYKEYCEFIRTQK